MYFLCLRIGLGFANRCIPLRNDACFPQVRGVLYDATKQKKKSSADKLKSKKKMAFETLDYELDDRNVINIGLGDAEGQEDAKRMKKDSSLSLEERLSMRNKKEDKLAVVRGQGASRSVTFIPKLSKGKRNKESSARSSRERRSMKELSK